VLATNRATKAMKSGKPGSPSGSPSSSGGANFDDEGQGQEDEGAAPENKVSARSFWKKLETDTRVVNALGAKPRPATTMDENGDGHHALHDNSLHHLDASFQHEEYGHFVAGLKED